MAPRHMQILFVGHALCREGLSGVSSYIRTEVPFPGFVASLFGSMSEGPEAVPSLFTLLGWSLVVCTALGWPSP